MLNHYQHPLTSLELRKAVREKYTWPGGYEMFGVCDDGGVLCCDCMRREYRLIARSRREADRHKRNDGWCVEAVDCTANTDSEVICDHCNKVIQEEYTDN